MQRVGRPFLDPKAQHRGEAQRAQNAQRVLTKPRVRVADAADETVPEIIRSPEGVREPVLRAPGHGVDGKVPAGQILGQRRREAHRVRVTGVGVSAVYAEGGDLDGQAAQQHRHRAVLQPGLDDPLPGEHRLRLLRQRGGGHVVVLGFGAHEPVPDAAAHGAGRVPGLTQTAQRRIHLFRKLHGAPPFSCNATIISEAPAFARFRQRKSCGVTAAAFSLSRLNKRP